MSRATLTNTRASPIFKVSTTYTTDGPNAALVSLTVTSAAFVYTDARCPKCRRMVLLVPGTPLLEVRPIAQNRDASGRGRVVHCPNRHCRTLSEVIER